VPRKTITTLAVAWMLAFPALGAWGAVQTSNAATPKKKVVKATTTVTGPSVECKRWGPIVVRIKVRKTTTLIGKKKRVAIKILALDFPVYPNATFRSRYINEQALPLLVEEVLEIQSANVELISGATDTTGSFKKSLQAAILRAKS
jgi:hypothetical protein